MPYDLARDWEIFAPLLHLELDSLGATEDEVHIIMDRAWHRTTTVESLSDYARGALALAREHVRPFDRMVDETPPPKTS